MLNTFPVAIATQIMGKLLEDKDEYHPLSDQKNEVSGYPLAKFSSGVSFTPTNRYPQLFSIN